MKNAFLCTFVACILALTVAVAQTTPRSQGTQGSSPTMSQPGAQGQPGYPGQQQPGTMGPNDQNSPNQNQPQEKSEKKMKGCVESQGGQYILETKKGKAIALTGQDVSAHVGHEVAVKGTWESASAGGSSAASSGSSEKMFNVASVDMISSSCSGKTKGSSGMNSGSSPSSGAQGSNTQPPQ